MSCYHTHPRQNNSVYTECSEFRATINNKNNNYYRYHLNSQLIFNALLRIILYMRVQYSPSRIYRVYTAINPQGTIILFIIYLYCRRCVYTCLNDVTQPQNRILYIIVIYTYRYRGCKIYI